ncbi:uncharacterized protein RHOBADRAFT_50740, partial [Rhodotorula graminis WP1]
AVDHHARPPHRPLLRTAPHRPPHPRNRPARHVDVQADDRGRHQADGVERAQDGREGGRASVGVAFAPHHGRRRRRDALLLERQGQDRARQQPRGASIAVQGPEVEILLSSSRQRTTTPRPRSLSLSPRTRRHSNSPSLSAAVGYPPSVQCT